MNKLTAFILILLLSPALGGIYGVLNSRNFKAYFYTSAGKRRIYYPGIY
ncbi:MAG: hypothetical protein AAF824_18415 [Bacteroidota bacterium]